MGATADLRQLDRVLASIPRWQSVWPDNGSQRLGGMIGQFDPDALLEPILDYTARAQNVVPFDLLSGISVTHCSSVVRSITRQYSTRKPTGSMPPSRNPEPAGDVEHCKRALVRSVECARPYAIIIVFR